MVMLFNGAPTPTRLHPNYQHKLQAPGSDLALAVLPNPEIIIVIVVVVVLVVVVGSKVRAAVRLQARPLG